MLKQIQFVVYIAFFKYFKLDKYYKKNLCKFFKDSVDVYLIKCTIISATFHWAVLKTYAPYSFICLSHLEDITIKIAQQHFTDHLNNSHNHFCQKKKYIKHVFIKMRHNFLVLKIFNIMPPESKNLYSLDSIS